MTESKVGTRIVWQKQIETDRQKKGKGKADDRFCEDLSLKRSKRMSRMMMWLWAFALMRPLSVMGVMTHDPGHREESRMGLANLGPPQNSPTWNGGGCLTSGKCLKLERISTEMSPPNATGCQKTDEPAPPCPVQS